MIYVLIKEIQEIINNNLEDLENSTVEPRFEMITYTMQKNRTRELYNGECRE